MIALTDANCFFNFLDSEAQMPAREFCASMKDICASFPNMHFYWTLMEAAGTNDKGTVAIARDYYGAGDHTGEPFGFGPYEPIPATGIHVRDEEIEVTLTVRDGKIMDVSVDASGKMVGPPGFYDKIGGLIMQRNRREKRL